MDDFKGQLILQVACFALIEYKKQAKQADKSVVKATAKHCGITEN